MSTCLDYHFSKLSFFPTENSTIHSSADLGVILACVFQVDDNESDAEDASPMIIYEVMDSDEEDLLTSHVAP
jgi:hypothetical protein